MTFSLTFTKTEMIEYLVMLGYMIESRHVEKEIHLHGSRFLTEIHIESYARKDDECGRVEDVFRDVMKRKLLAI